MSARVGVVTFPGSLDDRDAARAVRLAGGEPVSLWHADADLRDVDAVVLPGGFSYGDYLRCGAIARFAPVMGSIIDRARSGMPVLGICNGFQILCEAGLLPGALVANRGLKFICQPIHLRVESTDSVLTRAAEPGQVLRIPLNSYEGNYVATDIGSVEDGGNVVLRYVDHDGKQGEHNNPNGSTNAIAGVTNDRRNVAGLMPHPERASEAILGSDDGLVLLESFVASLDRVPA